MRLVELIKEISELGNQVDPNKFLMSAKVMETIGLLTSGDVEIPDECFTQMNRDMRMVALSGFLTTLMTGLAES